MKSEYRVSPLLRNPKAKDTSSIYLIVRIKSERILQYNTGVYCKPDDYKKGQYADIGRIEGAKTAIEKKISNYLFNNDNRDPDPDLVKSWLDDHFNRKTKIETSGFWEDFDRYATSRIYVPSVVLKLKEFLYKGSFTDDKDRTDKLKKAKPSLSYENIDTDFLVKFFKWLTGEQVQVNGNGTKQLDNPLTYKTAKMYLSKVKSFIYDKYGSSKPPFDPSMLSKKIPKQTAKQKREQNDHFALNEQQWKEFDSLKFKKGEQVQEKIHGQMILLLNSGQRYSDLSKLIPRNVIKVDGMEVLPINTQKTEIPAYIPVNDAIRRVWAKYGNDIKPYTLQHFNTNLKAIASRCKSLRTKDPKTGKPLHQLISSHSGRKSFATYFYDKGVNANQIMSCTAHDNLQTFLKYIGRPLTGGLADIVKFGNDLTKTK